MIFIMRAILHSRSGHTVLVTTVAMCALAAFTGRRSIELDLSAQYPPTKMAVVELCSILTATLLAIQMRPRFWEWDRLAARRPSGYRPCTLAAVTAAAGIGLPALCVPAVVPTLPPNTPWAWVLANALLMAAIVQLIAPLLTPLAAGTVALVAWFGCGLATNLAPGLWLPVSSYHELQGRWFVVSVLAVVTVVLHAVTCGRTTWAHRQFGKHE
ncbi:hypothetical protein [Actinophytocola sp.]|uniref:hypothetical protein n=1 Tax=Actinophytocola sp. TaxID=1872138 RepID=UPI002ED5001E